ncbi:MAG: NAD-dependent epimerase/dehydratase family protein [bacterium]
MAKYLITGGAGFIGCNIARELVRRRQDVAVLDNLSTGSIKNLKDIREDIKFIRGDIRKLDVVKRACRGVDYVLHQAALRAVERSVDDPRATNDNNITGTLNVLLAARDSGVKRVVSASSSSVYGNIKEPRQVEPMPLHPESPYALCKMAGEHYGRLFYDLYGLETVSLRYFNVFGPYQSPESKYSAVIPIYVKALRNGEAPDIHWHGRQSRDFTYVDNVVQANLKAARGERVKLGEAYNVGNGENISINDLYGLLQKLLGVSIKPNRTGKRAGDVLKTYADISKAERDFDYKPDVSFAEGLKKSIEWYKENL